ncbi:MAG: patatin-like phospholipase family protein [Longimicrobiales bacterium]
MERVVLVLGGGGVKGLAHVGAWKAVREAGVPVTEVVGTSIGALVGACVAGGREAAELWQQGLALRRPDIVALNRWALLLNGIRQPSVFRAEPFEAYIERVLPVARFEELELPLSLNATDLETGDEVWFGAGGRTDATVAEAVYASAALPLFYPPALIGGRHYVDGGVTDALAIERAAQRGAERIIAIDVGAGGVKDALDTVGKGLVAVHHRVYDIMNYARKRARVDAWSGPPLTLVRPRLDGYSTFDFGNARLFMEEGYRATREALGMGDVSVRRAQA